MNRGAAERLMPGNRRRPATVLLVAAAALMSGLSAVAAVPIVQRYGFVVFLVPIPILGIAFLTYLMYRGEEAAASARIDELMRTHLETIEALTIAIDAKDPHSRGHVRRVQAYALELARRVGIPHRDFEALRMAALLCDIGKLAIPDYLLNKPGKLSEVEYQKIKAHPKVAAEILAGVEFSYPVIPIIKHHHERWDGTGYPDGLKAEEIPLGGRILAVADTFEALTSERVYRGRKSSEEACALLEAWAGIHYDPQIVQILRANLVSIVSAADQAAAGPIAALEAFSSGGADASAFRPGVAALWSASEPGESGEFEALLHRGIGIQPEPRKDARESLEGRASARAALSDISSAHREVYALYEIAQTLGSSLRLVEVLDLVVSKIGQLVPYHTCVVYLLEDTGETLSARFVSGANADALRGRALRLGEGITGWAAAQKICRISTSPGLDLSGTTIDASDYSTVASFPLCHDGRILGAITLYFGKGIALLDDHVRMMEIIARLSSGAVLNSTIFAETQESALTDDLTHLPNSRYLRQVFEQETIRSQQAGQPMAFLEMDLDNFKVVNDRLGHQAGDRYLTEVSRVLRSYLRERDILVRLSGDEFGAILPLTGFAQASLLSERLQHAVDAFSLRLEDGKVARSGLSVGIALYPQDGESFEDLMMRADHNMYQNKAARKTARHTEAPNIIPFPIKTPGTGS
jgi:diguanylate cyclase (GGDEF)-like protein/putative nucleotidyltransferase with HDIG domain